MLDNGPAQSVEDQSLDDFLTVIQHLTFTQIILLSDKSLSIWKKLRSERAAEIIWKGYLQKLHLMDSTVPICPTDDVEDKGAWYFDTVTQAALVIYQRQREEMTYLKEKHRYGNNFKILDEIKTLKADEQNDSLDNLAARHEQLDALNSTLIRNRIDTQSTDLSLRRIGITRIPEALLSDETLADFWKKLTSLDCGDNNLQELPRSIGNLTALRILNCNGNQLSKLPDSISRLVSLRYLWLSNNRFCLLPESIVNLPSLERFYCGNNFLQELPEGMGKLVTLDVFYCENNMLKTLPESLGNLVKLSSFDCANNKLELLPESMGRLERLLVLRCNQNKLCQLPGSLHNLVALKEFDSDYNKLKQLPDFLPKICDDLWREKTLRKQKGRTPAPTFLNQFAALNLKAKLNETSPMHPSATTDPQEENAKKDGATVGRVKR